jgi:hypothetical protein
VSSADRLRPKPVTLIVEVNGAGHRLVYVRLLVTRAATEGHEVVVALPPGLLKGDDFAKHLGPVTGQFRVAPLERPASLAAIASLSTELGATKVLIPDGDLAAIRLGLGWRWREPSDLRVLVMRDPGWTRDESGRLATKARLKLALLKRAGRSPGVSLLWLREPGYVAKPTELVAHDPVVLDAPAGEILRMASGFRERMNLVDEVHWFGVVGAITGRKNVGLIAAALARVASLRAQGLGLAILGPWAQSMACSEEHLRRDLGDAGVHLVIDNHLYSNLDVNVAVASLDCVVMAYSSHSPNATLGKAAALGVPLIAAGPPSVRGFVSNVHGGQVARLDIEGLTAAVIRHLDSPKGVDPRRFQGDDFAGEMLGVIR